MGKRYLIDSNIVIYYLGEIVLPQKALDFLDSIFIAERNISVITRIEVLGFRFKDEADETKANEFIQLSRVIGITKAIEEATIRIRRHSKLRLPDSIIAATAVVEGLTLVTRDVNDFMGITGLTLLNAFEI